MLLQFMFSLHAFFLQDSNSLLNFYLTLFQQNSHRTLANNVIARFCYQLHFSTFIVASEVTQSFQLWTFIKATNETQSRNQHAGNHSHGQNSFRNARNARVFLLFPGRKHGQGRGAPFIPHPLTQCCFEIECHTIQQAVFHQ